MQRETGICPIPSSGPVPIVLDQEFARCLGGRFRNWVLVSIFWWVLYMEVGGVDSGRRKPVATLIDRHNGEDEK